MTEEFFMSSPAFSIASLSSSVVELADPTSPSIVAVQPNHPHPSTTIKSTQPHPSPATTTITTPGRDIFPHLWEQPSGWAKVGNRFQCLVPACHKAMFKRKFGLQRHWKQIHYAKVKRFLCNKPMCRVSTTNVDDMRNHI